MGKPCDVGELKRKVFVYASFSYHCLMIDRSDLPLWLLSQCPLANSKTPCSSDHVTGQLGEVGTGCPLLDPKGFMLGEEKIRTGNRSDKGRVSSVV